MQSNDQLLHMYVFWSYHSPCHSVPILGITFCLPPQLCDSFSVGRAWGRLAQAGDLWGFGALPRLWWLPQSPLVQLCILTTPQMPRKGSAYPREGSQDCLSSLRSSSSWESTTVGGGVWRPRRCPSPQSLCLPLLLTEHKHPQEILLVDLFPSEFIFFSSLTLSSSFGDC